VAAERTYRSALANLVLKDFRARYRNMSLGVLWSLLNPLVMMGILTLVFTVVYPNRAVPHFPVFLLIGLLAFNFFSLTLSSMVSCIRENEALVKKLPFPRVLLPVSILISFAIHALVQVSLLFVAILVLRVPLSVHVLWYPLTWIVIMAFTLGVGLLSSTLCVFFLDMKYLVQSGLTAFFWLTPVFYSLTTVHQTLPRWIFGAYLLNPLAGCIDAGRNAILWRKAPDAVAFGFAAGVSFTVLAAGWLVFRRYEYRLSDRL
jgi:ABC-type polysaccharide/polyol phosphate export permease